MSGRLRSKSAPSVLIPQYVTADTVIADDDIPDPSALRTFSNASTVIADDNYGYGGESKFYEVLLLTDISHSLPIKLNSSEFFCNAKGSGRAEYIICTYNNIFRSTTSFCITKEFTWI